MAGDRPVTRRIFIKRGSAAALGGSAAAAAGAMNSRAAHGQSSPAALERESVIRVKPPLILTCRSEKKGRGILEAAWKTWLATGSMLDAVERGANVAELDPEDRTVGYGGHPNEEGVVELDACIMSGPDHNCGAVASLRNIKRASSVARLVMERTDHIYLVGEGARRFALAHGFVEENLLIDDERRKWIDWKENLSPDDDWLPAKKKRPTGTINVLGIDNRGDVFGITTTSGLAYKIPGRVGDSPIIGAGLYLDNSAGAAGATGRGEEVVRTCGSFLVVEKMRDGYSPQQACEFALQRIFEVNRNKVDFDVEYLAVNVDGEIGSAQIDPLTGPNISAISEEGFKTFQGKSIKTG